MRKWIPLTFIGLGGVGAILYSLFGRSPVNNRVSRKDKVPERLAAWNEAAKHELDLIQQSLHKVEQSLRTHSATQ